MAFKEVAGTKKYFKYSECEKGDVLVEGKFIRDFEGKFGIQYEFEHKTGDIHVLNSSGQLNYKMDFVNPGERVMIIYDGSIILEKGAMKGKMAHQFKLLRDEEDVETDELDGPDQQDALSEGFDDDFMGTM